MAALEEALEPEGGMTWPCPPRALAPEDETSQGFQPLLAAPMTPMAASGVKELVPLAEQTPPAPASLQGTLRSLLLRPRPWLLLQMDSAPAAAAAAHTAAALCAVLPETPCALLLLLCNLPLLLLHFCDDAAAATEAAAAAVLPATAVKPLLLLKTLLPAAAAPAGTAGPLPHSFLLLSLLLLALIQLLLCAVPVAAGWGQHQLWFLAVTLPAAAEVAVRAAVPARRSLLSSELPLQAQPQPPSGAQAAQQFC